MKYIKNFIIVCVGMIICIYALLQTSILLERAFIGDQRIYMSYNLEQLKLSRKPIMDNERIMVPIEQLAEYLGYIVTRKGDAVSIKDDEIEIRLEEDNTKVWTNQQEEPISLEVAPVKYKRVLYVPLRFISEVFGLQVHWEAKERMVYLYGPHLEK